MLEDKDAEIIYIRFEDKLMDFFLYENVKIWKVLVLEKNIMDDVICLEMISRKIMARGIELETIHFWNVNPFKVGNLNFIVNLVRDLKGIRNLIIENCVINKDNIDAIGHFIRWKAKDWISIKFINCGITDKDLIKLIYFRPDNRADFGDLTKWTLTMEDYPKLELIDLSNNNSL
jgi:hypothetical protein